MNKEGNKSGGGKNDSPALEISLDTNFYSSVQGTQAQISSSPCNYRFFKLSPPAEPLGLATNMSPRLILPRNTIYK